MALNKVVQSFAKKNSKKPWPVFPGSDLQRGGVILYTTYHSFHS